MENEKGHGREAQGEALGSTTDHVRKQLQLTGGKERVGGLGEEAAGMRNISQEVWGQERRAV